MFSITTAVQRLFSHYPLFRDKSIQQQRSHLETKDILDYVMIQALREQLAAKGFILQ